MDVIPALPLSVGELRQQLLSRWSTIDEALNFFLGQAAGFQFFRLPFKHTLFLPWCFTGEAVKLTELKERRGWNMATFLQTTNSFLWVSNHFIVCGLAG